MENKNCRKKQKYYDTGSKQCYLKYVEKYPDTKLDFETWRKGVRTFNTNCWMYILDSGDRVKVPPIGSFAVSKKKMRKFVKVGEEEHITLPIDWQKSKKAGKRVYLLNTHSDGYKYWYQWFGVDAYFAGSYIWQCRFCRIPSRTLGKYIKEKGPEFAERYKEWTLTKERIKGK